MTYVHNPIKYVGPENKRWTYQDFSAGSITGTSVTLTANERGVNEDGSPLSFDSSKIISSTALILRSDNNKAVQRNGVTGFLGKVKVSSHSGASVTLSHVPNSSAPIRIWYHYSELASNIKNQTAVPPMFTGKQIEDMETIFNSKADNSLASVTEAGSAAQITTSDTVLSAFGKIMKYITDFLTTFNSANKLVQLDGSGLLPAVDGSQLTGIATEKDYVYSIKTSNFYTKYVNSLEQIWYNTVTSSRGSSISLDTTNGTFTVEKGKKYKITLNSRITYYYNSHSYTISIVVDGVVKIASVHESLASGTTKLRAGGDLTYIADIPAGTGTSTIVVRHPGGWSASTTYTPTDGRSNILVEEF